jgi:hypothetical protein
MAAAEAEAFAPLDQAHDFVFFLCFYMYICALGQGAGRSQKYSILRLYTVNVPGHCGTDF